MHGQLLVFVSWFAGLLPSVIPSQTRVQPHIKLSANAGLNPHRLNASLQNGSLLPDAYTPVLRPREMKPRAVADPILGAFPLLPTSLVMDSKDRVRRSFPAGQIRRGASC